LWQEGTRAGGGGGKRNWVGLGRAAGVEDWTGRKETTSSKLGVMGFGNHWKNARVARVKGGSTVENRHENL